ncbi:hypothetical protein C8J57DRAFT_7659 [Mycena rebaudengoi]|nr:hypothetical protein C8J57DRAFT_7659 [Mycena rebaudengoi]
MQTTLRQGRVLYYSAWETWTILAVFGLVSLRRALWNDLADIDILHQRGILSISVSTSCARIASFSGHSVRGLGLSFLSGT